MVIPYLHVLVLRTSQIVRKPDLMQIASVCRNSAILGRHIESTKMLNAASSKIIPSLLRGGGVILKCRLQNVTLLLDGKSYFNPRFLDGDIMLHNIYACLFTVYV